TVVQDTPRDLLLNSSSKRSASAVAINTMVSSGDADSTRISAARRRRAMSLTRRRPSANAGVSTTNRGVCRGALISALSGRTLAAAISHPLHDVSRDAAFADLCGQIERGVEQVSDGQRIELAGAILTGAAEAFDDGVDTALVDQFVELLVGVLAAERQMLFQLALGYGQQLGDLDALGHLANVTVARAQLHQQLGLADQDDAEQLVKAVLQLVTHALEVLEGGHRNRMSFFDDQHVAIPGGKAGL